MTDPQSQSRNNRSVIGLAALWIVLIAVDFIAAIGVAKLEFGHGLERVFSSKSQRYTDFVAVKEMHGHTSSVQLLVEGDTLTKPDQLAILLDLVLELQLTDGIQSVQSMFAIPIPTEQGVFTLDTLSTTNAISWAQRHAAQPLLQQMIAKDGRSALISIVTDETTASLNKVETITQTMLAQSELQHTLTGLPIILDHAGKGLKGDFFLLNSIGVALGLAIVFLAITGWWVAATTLLSCGTALLWGVGALGWLGVEMNVISIALPILILALSFSDAVHVGIEQGHQIRQASKHPIRATLVRMGPAVLLTSLTTAIAFISLTFSGSELIVEMGIGGAVAVIAASLGVLCASAILATTILYVLRRDHLGGIRGPATKPFFDWQWLPRLGLRNPSLTIAAGMAVTLIACLGYLSADTRFSFFENVTSSDNLRPAMERIARDLGPTSSVLIPVTVNNDDPLELAQAVAKNVRSVREVSTTLSLADLAKTAAKSNTTLDELLAQMPPKLRGSIDGTETGQLLVTVPFSYENSDQTRALATHIEAALAADTAQISGATARVTGPEVMSAFVSAEMISALSLSLIISVLAAGVIIAIWMRSLRAGLLALAPNLLPVAVVGGLLGLTGVGISFAAGIVLTLAFGIAVDDTIHVMNRYRLATGAPDVRVKNAMRNVTPPMVVTTLVLVAGLSGTIAASLPSVVEFGLLSIAVFGVALIADLVFLPALIRKFL